MGVERPSFHLPGCVLTSSGPGELEGSTPLAAVPFGVEASSPFKEQGVRLAPSMTAPDDEVPAAALGLGLPRGVPAMRKGSGGLLAHVLCLPHGPGGMAGDKRRASAASW